MEKNPYSSQVMDDDRVPVRAGDTVRFNYGIPPVVVDAKIVQRRGSLIALTPGHNPAECNLRVLRRYAGGWYKHNIKGHLRRDSGSDVAVRPLVWTRKSPDFARFYGLKNS
jgi:hypothetical protein